MECEERPSQSAEHRFSLWPARSFPAHPSDPLADASSFRHIGSPQPNDCSRHLRSYSGPRPGQDPLDPAARPFRHRTISGSIDLRHRAEGQFHQGARSAPPFLCRQRTPRVELGSGLRGQAAGRRRSWRTVDAGLSATSAASLTSRGDWDGLSDALSAALASSHRRIANLRCRPGTLSRWRLLPDRSEAPEGRDFSQDSLGHGPCFS